MCAQHLCVFQIGKIAQLVFVFFLLETGKSARQHFIGHYSAALFSKSDSVQSFQFVLVQQS